MRTMPTFSEDLQSERTLAMEQEKAPVQNMGPLMDRTKKMSKVLFLTHLMTGLLII